MLLHCYPFVREAGWLAHVYGNVWFDLSLTIPHVARPAEQLREALELAPVSKLLYASDAARTPELYFARGDVVARGARRGARRSAAAGRGRGGGARDPARERARAVPARHYAVACPRRATIYTSEWLELCARRRRVPDGTRFDHHVVRLPHPAVGVIVSEPSAACC